MPEIKATKNIMSQTLRLTKRQKIDFSNFLEANKSKNSPKIRIKMFGYK